MFVFPLSPCKKGQRRWVEYSTLFYFKKRLYLISSSILSKPENAYNDAIFILENFDYINGSYDSITRLTVWMRANLHRIIELNNLIIVTATGNGSLYLITPP